VTAAAIGCEAVESGMSESAGSGTGAASPWTPPDAGGSPAAWETPPREPQAGTAPGSGYPPPIYPPRAPAMRMPSGLFPSGPPRPIFREPFPIRGGAVALGMVGGGLWMMLFGLLASSATGYVWIAVIAGFVAWLVALLLARRGDRGAAVGLAMSTAVGLSIAMIVLAVRWAAGDWLLW
jgi:hypothetical protein